jgi:hemerythrin-like domain-containing protein
MKRNINIVPLSKDHHNSLLFSWKIRQGISKHIAIERIRKYVQYFWEDHLQKHFEEEETILFNKIQHELCEKAYADHAAIRSLIEEINKGNAPVEKYTLLADILEQHIRFEERTLFIFLEKTLDPAQLSEIGAKLGPLHEVVNTDTYPDEFWT